MSYLNFCKTKYNSDEYFKGFYSNYYFLYSDIITKLKTGNLVIIIHTCKKRKIEGATIKIYNLKLQKIFEIYININISLKNFYELKNGNMVCEFKKIKFL